jgi:pyridoxine kinase
MAILSIQSQVAAGHVGNSAAVFALQRLGREVWPIPTTLLSHHPGHGGAEGGPLPAALLDRILDGLRHRGCFSRCEAVLSGYLAYADNAACILRAVTLAKAASPGAVYLCDPVLGDDGRLYVSGDIVAAMHNLAAKADIITPNAFELSVLSGVACRTREDALRAMRLLQSKGPKVVVLSSFSGSDTALGTLDMLAVDGSASWALNIPALGQKFYGAGDLFTCLFLDAWLERPAAAQPDAGRRNTGVALGKACAAVQAVLAQTAVVKADELQLIQAQTLLAAPHQIFLPERIS